MGTLKLILHTYKKNYKMSQEYELHIKNDLFLCVEIVYTLVMKMRESELYGYLVLLYRV